MHRVGLGLGANLGDPATQMRAALTAIAADELGRVVRASSVWRSPPWGFVEQPPFLNACVLLETVLSPHALLDALKRIERQMGRIDGGQRWGPRMIDLDILFFDELASDDPELTLPHKDLFGRAFVLAPLLELGIETVAGRSLQIALAQCDRSGLEIAAPPFWPLEPGKDGSVGETITLRCADGQTLDAWCARPVGTPKGGMVVLQEIFGVNAHIRSVADRYAQAGYLAVAPALFDRVERGVELGYDGSDMDRARDLRGRTQLEKTLFDIGAAVAAAGEAGPVGVVGYCWGGALAWAASARIHGIAAAVGYYGGMIVSMIDETPRTPVMLHFGSKDKHIPLSDVEKIRDTHPQVPVFVYDADHGFNCDARASFDASAAEIARERTVAFFAEHVR